VIRRQASLYIPEPARYEIDVVRKRADPVQFSLIPAHVTLCREDEVLDWSEFVDRVRCLGRFELSLEFGSPLELDDGCVLLPCVKGKSLFNQLRGALLSSGGVAPRVSDPHITLLHPRNAVTGQSIEWLLESLTHLRSIGFSSLNIIEQQGGSAWRVLHELPLQSAEA